MPLSPADTPYLFELYALTEIAKAQEEARPNRTDIDTYSRFGSLTEYDLSGGTIKRFIVIRVDNSNITPCCNTQFIIHH